MNLIKIGVVLVGGFSNDMGNLQVQSMNSWLINEIHPKSRAIQYIYVAGSTSTILDMFKSCQL